MYFILFFFIEPSPIFGLRAFPGHMIWYNMRKDAHMSDRLSITDTEYFMRQSVIIETLVFFQNSEHHEEKGDNQA